MAVMLEMIADKSLTQEWRMDILGRIKETAPTLSRGRLLKKSLPTRFLELGGMTSFHSLLSRS
jgi:hypothetical protein